MTIKIDRNLVIAGLNRGVVVASKRDLDRKISLFEWAASAELFHSGFNIAPESLTKVSKNGIETLVSAAREASNVDRNWEPMYPNFPKSVRSSSSALSLLIDQIVHYLSNGTLVPSQEKEVRSALPMIDSIVSNKALRVLSADDALASIAEEVVTRSVAMSRADEIFLSQVISSGALDVNDESVVSDIISKAGNRENVSKFLSVIVGSGETLSTDQVVGLIRSAKNADAILRIVLPLYSTASTGKESDYANAVESINDSFTYAVRFTAVPSAVRKAIVKRLGQVTGGFRADMLVSRKELWRKLFKSIHGFSVARDAEAVRALDIVHDNVEYRTLDSVVEALIDTGDCVELAKILHKERPSALVRRLGKIVSLARGGDVSEIARLVESIGNRVPLTTLISGYNGIVNYNENDVRVIRASGRNNTLVSNNTTIDSEDQKTVLNALYKAILSRLSSSEATLAFGVSDINAPVSLMERDASSTDRSLTRGERVAIEGFGAGKTVRAFTHWYNLDRQRIDIDLAVGTFSDDWKLIEVASWNSQSHTKSLTYSGDLTNAPLPHGAAEYVDINLDSARREGARWAVMGLNVYAGSLFADLDSVSGVMVRSDADAGEIFDARSVATAFTSNSQSRSIIPVVVDLQNGEFVWIDSSDGSDGWGGSFASDIQQAVAVVKNEVARDLFSYEDLANAYAEAHGAEQDSTVRLGKDELNRLVK